MEGRPVGQPDSRRFISTSTELPFFGRFFLRQGRAHINFFRATGASHRCLLPLDRRRTPSRRPVTIRLARRSASPLHLSRHRPHLCATPCMAVSSACMHAYVLSASWPARVRAGMLGVRRAAQPAPTRGTNTSLNGRRERPCTPRSESTYRSADTKATCASLAIHQGQQCAIARISCW